jgi:hypothetical protein
MSPYSPRRARRRSKIKGWQKIKAGEDFHARYLLTDRGGIAVDAGFSAEGNHQTTEPCFSSSVSADGIFLYFVTTADRVPLGTSLLGERDNVTQVFHPEGLCIASNSQ